MGYPAVLLFIIENLAAILQQYCINKTFLLLLTAKELNPIFKLTLSNTSGAEFKGFETWLFPLELSVFRDLSRRLIGTCYWRFSDEVQILQIRSLIIVKSVALEPLADV